MAAQTVIALKLNTKLQFAFLIVFVNSVLVIVTAAIQDFYPMSALGFVVMAIATIVANMLVAYLSTEEQNATGPPPGTTTQQPTRRLILRPGNSGRVSALKTWIYLRHSRKHSIGREVT